MVARDIERLSAPRHPAPRVNPNVREGLPLRMRCEVGAATVANDSPVGDVGSGGGCVNARQRGMWTPSFLLDFAGNLKLVFKK